MKRKTGEQAIMLFNKWIKTCISGDGFSGALDCFSSDICFLIVGCCKSLRFFSFGSLSLLHLSGVWRMVKEKVNKVKLMLNSHTPYFRDSEQLKKLHFALSYDFALCHPLIAAVTMRCTLYALAVVHQAKHC